MRARYLATRATDVSRPSANRRWSSAIEHSSTSAAGSLHGLASTGGVAGGFYRGLPLGLSFFGAPFSEGRLLGLAYAWEQATQHRRPPTYRATALPDAR